MKALVVVDAGICGFQTRIHAESDDLQNVTFKAMQVAAGVALPKDVTLKIAAE